MAFTVSITIDVLSFSYALFYFSDIILACPIQQKICRICCYGEHLIDEKQKLSKILPLGSVAVQ
ncbi:hypothetical protein OBV_43370 [Oscillibacter valericigenes Sjm18-20]|nr:hypothetical protein OBV_43370 [Oscillibacter valericigenes Sjm18-20]